MMLRGGNGRPVLAALAALVLLAGPGCLPGVGWLPDSSGFVYTGGKMGRRLVHYDVAANKSTVLVEDVGGVAWPVVSPDGKRIAVAVRTFDRDEALMVRTYDRAGKLLQSNELARQRYEKGSSFFPYLSLPLVGWSADGNQLVVGAVSKPTYLHDLKSETTKPLKGELVVFGSSALRPDGKAFVVQDKGDYHQVDFAGKPQRLAGAVPLFEAPKKGLSPEQREVARGLGTMASAPFLFDSRWDGPVAVVAWRDKRIRLDTAKGTIIGEAVVAPQTKDGKVVREAHVFEGGVGLRVVELRAPNSKDLPGVVPCRVEVVRGKKKVEVVVAEAGLVKMFPSPDRRLVALRWFRGLADKLGSPIQSGLVVIDSSGKVLTRTED